MKHIKTYLIAVIQFLTFAATAQEMNLTTSDVVLGGRATLAPQQIHGLKWIKATDMYSYIDTTAGIRMMRSSVKSNDIELLKLTEVNEAMKKAAHDTLKSFPSFKWESHRSFSFSVKDTLFSYDLLLRRVSTLFTKPENKTVTNITTNDQNQSIAFTVDNNLWLYKDGKHIQITNESEVNIIYGQSVHRDEFGITKGIFWSPKGNYIAFYRMDQTMVTDYPITEWENKPAHVRNIKYPFSGDKSHHVTIGIYNLADGSTVYLKTGTPEEQYLTNIAWSPDEKSIYVVILNREQNHFDLNQYSVSTGMFVKTLFGETQEKYVQPLSKIEFLPGRDDRFIWQSKRDGFNHLYLYDISGKLIRQLTKGEWEVTRFEGFGSNGKYVFFTAALNSSITRDFCRTEIATGAFKKLTSGLGVHTVNSNEAKTLFIDNFTSTKTPRVISILNENGKKLKTLLQADNPLKQFKPVSVELFTIKNREGTDLQCRITRPVVLEPGKRYPVIVYVYNGPGVQLISDQWPTGNELWYHYMAQNNYIVFTMDGRGTPNRGREFEQVTFRQLGVVESSDQIEGVNFLKTLPYVDSTRIGVYGWSYGGFMTTTLMTRYPDVFKVGVAGGPVIDWKLYEIMYTERYMDTPQENPEGYEKTSVLNMVKNLKGKLLLIHGTSDDVVVQQHTMLFLKKAIDLNKQADYFLYPGHLHNVQGKDRIHLLDKISEYFFNFL
ncbi:MAG: DPP IV N-terminal domain-containing protein [Bacteroidia bacterium]|nr:DPP IV N-terminal domain-containing protein [Bacteroidia bacterium]MCZ2276791.1 DPP IV N-terminal domain-containing protein [Bacteroidia bacterium]